MKIFIKILFLQIVFFSLDIFGQIPQTNNLISYYPFLGNLEDQSGQNHNTGSINGNPTLTQNRFGTNNTAYYLDGIDDYLYFGNSIYADLPDTDGDSYFEDSYSISIWAKSSVVDNENFLAFGQADGLYTGMISVIGTNITFNSNNWGFPSTSTSGKKYDNNWHQYTFVYEAGSFRKLFIDGNLVTQQSTTDRLFRFKNYGLSVGVGRFDAAGNPEGIATTYTGSVDDVRIWNVALTNTEVSNLYTYENNAANDFSLPPPTPFVTTWQTDGSNNIIIPLTGGGYDFTIDWGDGTTEIKTGTPGNISHTYSTAGVKTVSIMPNVITGFPRIYVNNFGNRLLLKTIESWGSGQWGTSVDRAFYGATNLEVNATDIPNFSNTTNFQYMFLNCTSVTGTNGFANWTLNTNPTANVSFSAMFYTATQFNGDISNWDVSRVNTFDNMFNNAQKFNQNIGSWNVSNATNMASIFQSTILFNQDLSGWDVSNVTNMSSMFNDTRAFNSSLNWGIKTANVTNMTSMFQSSRVFDQNISGWNVSSVTNMSSMFYDAKVFNQDISAWDVSSVTNMSSMLRQMPLFNQPLDAWGTKTGNVTNMQEMFRQTPLFNQPINSWDVSKVTTTYSMFNLTSSFNQDLNSWNVGNLVNASYMFSSATSFNGNISGWVFTTDPAKTINAEYMFHNTTAFNQDISLWNVERFTSMKGMFQSTILFNQDLNGWDVSNVINMSSMFYDTRAFNSPLNWGIKTANVTNMSSMFRSSRVFDQNISGWNVSSVTNMSSMFYDAKVFNQDISAWDVTSVTNMSSMLRQMPLFNQPLDAWGTKTGNVTNMQEMFRQTPLFNQPINSWDVSKVTTTYFMFYLTSSFNQDLNSWNVGNLVNAGYMFSSATSFNGNISSWVFTTDPAKTINAEYMFQNTTAFNQDISLWNVERFTSMKGMFQSTILFNQDLSGWDVSNVTNMSSMFNDTRAFNSSLNWGIKTANVTNMTSMFQSSRVFDQNISGWNVSSVTNMSSMFYDAKVFNQDISAWDVSSVTNMSSMFRQMPLFNQPLDAWGTKTGNVTNMQEMFRDSPLFNKPINSWDVSKVTNTYAMFYTTTAFNQPLNSWNVGNLLNASHMFGNATSFNQDISAWNISKVTTLQNFLVNGKLSRANYDALLLGWSTLDAGETLVPINLNAHFGSSKYSDTAAVLTARNTTLITAKNWTITDGGMDPDVIVPFIVSSALASNNATITITFSENVYRTNVASGSLEATDFLFSLSGGTATLNTTIPSSITFSNNLTFVLGIDINGTPNGTEVLTVTPVLNSIFDISGNAAATTQSNNTAQLNDFKYPIITGPNSTSGLNSSLSINENTAAVHTFLADEVVNWSLGNTNDEALLSMDSNGNLVFNTAPDFENPLSTLNSNTYVVEIIATDAANNTTSQTLTITILDIANSTFGTFATITKQYFAGTHTIVPPTTNNSNPIVYTSDNLAVATVSGSVITFTGVGTANITASQATDANYEANAISTLLTVLGKDLVSKYGGISSTDTNYVDTNGNINGAFGLDKYGKQEYVLGDLVSLGLVMHLDAGNMSSYPGSGTTWTDLSGNGNHGTLQNGVAFTNVNNGAMVFDGVNDYFVTNNNLDLSNTDKLTIQIILKTASSNTQMIMEHSDNWNSNNAFGIICNNLSDRIQITDHNQGYNVSNSVASVNNNNWHLFTATTDRSLNAADQNLIYIDDNAANKVNVTNLTNDNSGNFTSHKLYISARAGSSLHFNGAIAQVLIYNRVLTAAEIQQNFNYQKTRYGL